MASGQGCRWRQIIPRRSASAQELGGAQPLQTWVGFVQGDTGVLHTQFAMLPLSSCAEDILADLGSLHLSSWLWGSTRQLRDGEVLTLHICLLQLKCLQDGEGMQTSACPEVPAACWSPRWSFCRVFLLCVADISRDPKQGGCALDKASWRVSCCKDTGKMSACFANR